MSPVVTWGLRYAACVAIGLALPFMPAPVRPFIVVVVAFGAWALAANDAKRDERDDHLRDVPILPAPARRRARPRPVPSTQP